MRFTEAIENFNDYLIIQRGYSPATARGYRSDLRMFDNFLSNKGLTSPNQVKQVDIVGFLAFLSQPHLGKNALQVISRARKIASIRSFFTYLRKTHVIKVSPAEDIEMPKLPFKESEYLTVSEYQHLLETITASASPYFKLRDLTIFTLFLGTGIRVSELVNLTVGDVDAENHSIKVHRKGNKEQTLPLNAKVRSLLYRYIKNRPDTNSSNVFISKKHKGMRQNTVYCLASKYLELAHIHKSRHGLHLMRHSCFSALLAKNVNPVIIQTIAGHASMDTTRRYLHLNQDQVKKALSKISL